jgi:hypothetical protein
VTNVFSRNFSKPVSFLKNAATGQTYAICTVAKPSLTGEEYNSFTSIQAKQTKIIMYIQTS